MRKPYADYACFALRAYFDETQPCQQSEAEQRNMATCEKVCQLQEERTLNILKDIYQRRDMMSDIIYQVSKERNIPQNDLWTLIAKIEKLFAKERGLI